MLGVKEVDMMFLSKSHYFVLIVKQQRCLTDRKRDGSRERICLHLKQAPQVLSWVSLGTGGSQFPLVMIFEKNIHYF